MASTGHVIQNLLIYSIVHSKSFLIKVHEPVYNGVIKIFDVTAGNVYKNINRVI